MKNTETKAKINLDESPLGALHKVHTHIHTCDVSSPQREGGGKGGINTSRWRIKSGERWQKSFFLSFSPL